jgi:hypothetical protein
MVKPAAEVGQPDVIARTLKQEWGRLRDAYLPVSEPKSIWRLSRKPARGDARQGWKLHISATVLSAPGVFRVVAPYLKRRGIMFKAPGTLAELQTLNDGVDYAFSQVGKFITVYPPSTEIAVAVAFQLHRLTAGFRGPVIPYDNQLRRNSCVYYRYGSFSSATSLLHGKKVVSVTRPDGKQVRDRRAPGTAVPRWIADPFRSSRAPAKRLTPLDTDYRDYQALTQRGRGGVYRALDISLGRTRRCIIKEGRRHGGTDLLGRDGRDFVEEEARFLRSNAGKVSGLPRVFATFRADECFYLVIEDIPGRNLQRIIAGREPISLRRRLSYGKAMAKAVAQIHAAGWAWLDCKPFNFLCQRGGKMRPIDFEGARRLTTRDLWPLGTVGYFERDTPRHRITPEEADLFALGISLAQVLTRTPSASKIADVFKRKAIRQRLPPTVMEMVLSLLRSKPNARPRARAVYDLMLSVA